MFIKMFRADKLVKGRASRQTNEIRINICGIHTYTCKYVCVKTKASCNVCMYIHTMCYHECRAVCVNSSLSVFVMKCTLVPPERQYSNINTQMHAHTHLFMHAYVCMWKGNLRC